MISLSSLNFNLSDSRVIYVSNTKFVVYELIKGALGTPYLFTHEEYTTSFADYLNNTMALPIVVLVDTNREDFRPVSIPHVYRQHDRAQLVERSRLRLSRHTDYFFAQYQGTVTIEQKRREDHYLFMSLSDDHIIKPLVDVCAKYHVPLRGILSVPQLLQSLIKTLVSPLPKNALLVSLHSISGLRQTLFKNGQLRLSRLSHLPQYAKRDYYPQWIYKEISKVLGYLHSVKLVDGPVDIYLLADQQFFNQSQDLKNLGAYHFLDIKKYTDGIRSFQQKTHLFADSLMMHHLLRKPPNNFYAKPDQMRDYKILHYKYLFNVLSCLLLLFVFCYSSFNLTESMSYRRDQLREKQDFLSYQQQYLEKKQALPQLAVNIDSIGSVLSTVNKIIEYKATPLEMLVAVSHGFVPFPEIKLQRLIWKHGDLNTQQMQTEMTQPESETMLRQTVELYVRIEPFNGNYRQANQMIKDFALLLDEQASIDHVEIESLPLDPDSQITLSGDVAIKAKEASASIIVIMRQ